MTYVHVSRLPAHVAIVMDGNGRWAQQQGKPRPEGHRVGAKAVRRIVRLCRRLGVPSLTLYAFSEQNWDRPRFEVDALMGLLHEFLVSERDEILHNSIRLRSIGDEDRLPPFVRNVLTPLCEHSANNKGMTLTLALSYGGREELAHAARALAEQVSQGTLNPEDINEQQLEKHLPSMVPGPVDLLIRTGGEQRISNFLLWGTAYAELFFTPSLWPDYTEADFMEAIAAFQHRERRYGLVQGQQPAHSTATPEGSSTSQGADTPQERSTETNHPALELIRGALA